MASQPPEEAEGSVAAMAALGSRKRRAPTEDCFELTPSEVSAPAPKQVRPSQTFKAASTFETSSHPTEPRAPQKRLERTAIGFSPLRRAALAVVQVPTDFNMDSEAALLIANFQGVELRMQKITGLATDLCTPESYLPARKNVRDAAEALNVNNYCSVVGLACTSMSFTLGPEIVDAELKIAHPKAKPVDMARSQVKAIRTLGCTVIGLVTPYIDAFHNNNINMLESGGDVTVASSVNLGLVKDEWTSMVDQQTITDAVKEVIRMADTPLDAVVLGCSAFRVCVPGYISELETETGVSIVTSTQAFYWNCLRTGGVEDQIDGYGRLFQEF
mmetsp:Transcript_89318/g.255001  ORF Transcript_89318/g.255001 Transcript_89318/m.255001 type:complete len:330 (-) Transcript_89318:175-1164(-)